MARELPPDSYRNASFAVISLHGAGVAADTQRTACFSTTFGVNCRGTARANRDGWFISRVISKIEIPFVAGTGSATAGNFHVMQGTNSPWQHPRHGFISRIISKIEIPFVAGTGSATAGNFHVMQGTNSPWQHPRHGDVSKMKNTLRSRHLQHPRHGYPDEINSFLNTC